MNTHLAPADGFLAALESQNYKTGGGEGVGRSQVAAMARAKLIQSRELLLALSHGCRGSRT